MTYGIKGVLVGIVTISHFLFTPLAAFQGHEAIFPAPLPEESHKVEVELTASAMLLPDEIESGKVVFEVKNGDDKPHGFAITGQGVEAELEEDIPPGETKKLEVKLLPGTYKLYCPEQPDLAGELKVVE